MFSLFTGACFLLILCVPALAASDAEIAERCVAGASTITTSHAQISFVAGGTLQGFARGGMETAALSGTWIVKDGNLLEHVASDTGRIRDMSFPVRMDESGRCYITYGTSEALLQKP